MIRCDPEGKDHQYGRRLWLRTPYPHDTRQLRMLVHAHLDRAIVYERARTLRRFQGCQLRDGPDLTPVLQPDSELTPPAQRHHMTVHQLTAFNAWARHLTMLPVVQPLVSLLVAVRRDWSTVESLAHSGQRWRGHEVARSPRPVACHG